MNSASILQQAQKSITDAGIDQDLRSVAFRWMLDRLSLESKGQSTKIETTSTAGTTDLIPNSEHVFQAISARIGASPSQVEDIYSLIDGKLNVNVDLSKLDKSLSKGTLQIAILLTAGRQAAELEPSTGIDDIRSNCVDHKRLDRKNFSTSMNNSRSVFQIHGKDKERRFRLNSSGWQQATELIQMLTGGTY